MRSMVAIGCLLLFPLALAGCGSNEPAPAAASTDPAALTGAVWRLQDASAASLVQNVPAGVVVSIEFADGRASGHSGCNGYSGGYEAKSDGSISFDQFAATVMACPDPEAGLESAYLAALAKATSFSVGDVLTLKGGGATLTFAREAAPTALALVGTEWTLASMASGTVSSTSSSAQPVTLVLAADGSAAGSGGCNGYHGSYTTQGDSLSFGPLATTKKLCESEVMSKEHAYLDALAQVATFSIDGSQLTLAGSSQGTLLTFVGPSG